MQNIPFQILRLVSFTILIGINSSRCSSNFDNHNETISEITVDPQEPAEETGDGEVDNDMDDNLPNLMNTRNCQCGVKILEPGKIVGGSISAENDWPWLAALIYNGGSKPKQFCGSTLINDRYLLTAAHCVNAIPVRGLDKFKVFLGGNIIPEETNDILNISSVRMHPRYDPRTLENDLALVHLTNPVKFSNLVKPICLSQERSPFVGEKATVVGWGLTLENTTRENVLLREVEVEILRNSKCQESYEQLGIKISSNMLCASLPGKDSCKGDSGGPLIASHHIEGDETETIRYNLIGVVSFGQRCASPIYPGVYTRIEKLMSWIRKNTRDAFNCIQ